MECLQETESDNTFVWGNYQHQKRASLHLDRKNSYVQGIGWVNKKRKGLTYVQKIRIDNLSIPNNFLVFDFIDTIRKKRGTKAKYYKPNLSNWRGDRSIRYARHNDKNY